MLASRVRQGLVVRPDFDTAGAELLLLDVHRRQVACHGDRQAPRCGQRLAFRVTFGPG